MRFRIVLLIVSSALLLSGCYMGWGHHGYGWHDDDDHHHGPAQCRRYETVDGERRCVDWQ